MRIRLAHAVATLLLLGAFVLPATDAKTGDATCVGAETWFDDAEGDGGYFINGALAASGTMDLDTFIVKEEGTDCNAISFTLSVDGSDQPVFSPDSVTYKVDLVEPETDDPDFTIEYTFSESTESVVLKKDGAEVTTDVTTSGTGSELTIRVAKSVFAGITQFDSVSATTESINGDLSAIQAAGLEEDSASSDVDLIVNYGLDSDEDGLPDAWETANFDNITATDGTGDKDGDGVSDAQEFADGTDPGDASDCICAPEEEEEEEEDTDTDGDGLEDAWETEHFGNLDQNATGDPDGDGCNNACEQEHGTDPNNPDTDGDGQRDGYEVDQGSDANDATSLPENPETEPLLDRLTADPAYLGIAAGGAAGVVALSLIALLARWKL